MGPTSQTHRGRARLTPAGLLQPRRSPAGPAHSSTRWSTCTRVAPGQGRSGASRGPGSDPSSPRSRERCSFLRCRLGWELLQPSHVSVPSPREAALAWRPNGSPGSPGLGLQQDGAALARGRAVPAGALPGHCGCLGCPVRTQHECGEPLRVPAVFCYLPKTSVLFFSGSVPGRAG